MSTNRMKLSTIAALSLAASVCLGAETQEAAAQAGVDEHEPPWFEAGFDNDLFSAYVWRNSLLNDRMVWQPCVYGDFTRFEPFYIGFSIWQNWDLNGRRSATLDSDGLKRAMNETDYEIHIGATVWESEDEEWSLELELGHEWDTYRTDRGPNSEYLNENPSESEIFVKATFNTPWVAWYGQCNESYLPTTACYFETGFNREITLAEMLDSENDVLSRLTVGGDWNVSFASGKCLTDKIYGVGTNWDPEEEEFRTKYLSDGIGGTTVKFNLSYQVCDCFSIGGLIAYTAVLNEDVRDGLRATGAVSESRELAWGGFQAKLSF